MFLYQAKDLNNGDNFLFVSEEYDHANTFQRLQRKYKLPFTQDVNFTRIRFVEGHKIFTDTQLNEVGQTLIKRSAKENLSPTKYTYYTKAIHDIVREIDKL